MSDGVFTLALPAGAFLAGWLLLSLLIGVLFAVFAGRLARLEPAQRALVLLALVLAPVAVAGLATLAVFAPAIGGWLLDSHCHAHGCGPHAPDLTTSAVIEVAVAGAIAGATTLAVLVLGQALVRSIGVGRSVLAFAERGPRDYGVLEIDAPAAYCVGLLRPHTVVSRGLLAHLDTEQLRVVLAHERGHAVRRDNLRHLAAALCSLLLPAGLRRRLLGDLRLAAEQACDRCAVRAVGDALVVADTLVRVWTVSSRSPLPVWSTAFCPHAIEARVAALLAVDTHRTIDRRLLAALITGGYLGLVFAGAELIHHGIEALGALI